MSGTGSQEPAQALPWHLPTTMDGDVIDWAVAEQVTIVDHGVVSQVVAERLKVMASLVLHAHFMIKDDGVISQVVASSL
eukprot:1158764-Pelagomonas_calceolata.AAC.5